MVQIRPAAENDIPAITKIYAGHVRHGLASFEIEPPDENEMLKRWRALQDLHLPYLVADDDGEIAGYAYAGPYRARPAYRFSVENSVYIAPGKAGRGLGRRLLSELIDVCERSGYRQMIAIIGDSGNAASVGLHTTLGFEQIGVLRSVGFKAGRWVESVLMQRPLGCGDGDLPETAV